MDKGSVCVISNEPVPPYERPALTKSYLHPPSSTARARLPSFNTCTGRGSKLQDGAWYEKQGIELLLSTQATEVQYKNKKVLARSLSSSESYEIAYRKLIIATGCRARTLPGAEGLKNVFTVRTEQDAALLVSAMEREKEKTRPPEVLVVGGGFLGLETACALSGWDCGVVLAYSGDDILPGVLTPEISDWFERYLRSKGIAMLSRSKVERIEQDGKITRAVFANGSSFDFDIAVVGIGALPNMDVLTGGIDLAPVAIGGVECDETLRSSDEDVYACGDVAAFPTIYGSFSRYEHVDHCRTSAQVVVNNALNTDKHGEEEVYHYLPYFYTNLFEYTEEPITLKFYGSNKSAIALHAADRQHGSDDDDSDSEEEAEAEEDDLPPAPVNFGSFEEGAYSVGELYIYATFILSLCG